LSTEGAECSSRFRITCLYKQRYAARSCEHVQFGKNKKRQNEENGVVRAERLEALESSDTEAAMRGRKPQFSVVVSAFQLLRIADFAGRAELAEHLPVFNREWKPVAHPFNWNTKSVAKIMAKCEITQPSVQTALPWAA
jgi:hypothetical protein